MADEDEFLVVGQQDAYPMKRRWQFVFPNAPAKSAAGVLDVASKYQQEKQLVAYIGSDTLKVGISANCTANAAVDRKTETAPNCFKRGSEFVAVHSAKV